MKKTALQKAREQRGWTQKRLAELLGTTTVTISRWESGAMLPRGYFRAKLAELFGLTEQELGLDESTPIDAGPDGGVIDPAIPLPSAIRLVGRETALTELKQRLYAGGSVALTALNGLPGVGKTTLVLALAHDPEVRAYFRDGVLWAGLGPTPNLLGLLNRWGTLLGISSAEMASLPTSEAGALLLRRTIGQRRMLIVIDDAWRAEDALFCHIGGPNCAHLVTTRFPGIAAQVASDGATVLKELDYEQSMVLLQMLAPTVVSQHIQSVYELIEAVGGLPLALTLLGKYLNVQAYSGQARRITQALEKLRDAETRLHISEPRAPVERHSSLPTDASLSLESVIAVTDQQLGDQARQGLYALSVFPPKPSSFSEEAALVVTGLPIEVLDTLIDFGLLESSGNGRYTLHQTIADYASLRLQNNPPLQQAAHKRFITYISIYIETHEKVYKSLSDEKHLLLAALEITRTYDIPDALIQLSCTLAPFFLAQGEYPLATLYAERADLAASQLNPQLRVKTLFWVGKITAKKAQRQKSAFIYFQEGLTLARGMKSNEWISAYLNELAWTAWKQGDYTLAMTYFQEGLAIARQLQHKERTCQLLYIASAVTAHQGDYTSSETCAREGLQIAKELNDLEQIGLLLISLGVTLTENGKDEEAEQSFLEALAIARHIGHREWTVIALINLGQIEVDQGRFTEALEHYQAGLKLTEGMDAQELKGVLQVNMGEAATEQGNYVEAEPLLQAALQTTQMLSHKHLRCQALNAFGNLRLRQGRLNEAEDTFSELQAETPEGDTELLAFVYYGQARIALAHGNREAAKTYGKTALKLCGAHYRHKIQSWLSQI